jgi:uncharacterized protein
MSDPSQSSKPSFVIHNSRDNQLYFTLRAPNHEVILTSETYQSLSALKNGIESVRIHAPETAHFVLRASRAGEPYFVLRAANHEVLGTSEMYSSRNACEAGIASVGLNAPIAEIVDRRE